LQISVRVCCAVRSDHIGVSRQSSKNHRRDRDSPRLLHTPLSLRNRKRVCLLSATMSMYEGMNRNWLELFVVVVVGRRFVPRA
jgi:hypothetical protein